MPTPIDDEELDAPVKPELAALEGPFVKSFLGQTTFERELTSEGNLEMLGEVAKELGAPELKSAIELQNLMGGEDPPGLKDRVLRASIRFGKGRFSQVASRHVSKAELLPVSKTPS